jgi:hypothetical protein
MLALPATAVTTQRQRRVCLVMAGLVLAMAVVFWPTAPVSAAPDQCGYKEWANPANFQSCINKLPAVSSSENDCMGVPTPDTPDSGFGGWFASNPHVRGVKGYYSTYGYSGYDYPLYNPDCITGNPLPNDGTATTTIANGELMVATGIIGAANALREWAYEPAHAWGWSNQLVKSATQAIYEKVFSVFGVITIAVVGIYLVWRSRQANMSDALTTAGWAVLVMVVVTAVASWPLVSAHLADSTLVTSLGIIHSAVGPQPQNTPISQCVYAQPNPPQGFTHDPSLCKDHRSAAILASDTATQTVLYDNWLRGTLGSSTSTTAQTYGPALYDSSALSWSDAAKIERAEHPKNPNVKPDPSVRAAIYAQKAEDFRRIANQIKTEDPNAYNYLTGKNGTARIGDGLIAILSALGFAFFDIAASLLVILGFLIFRWAVVATPILGTIAILRPASAGFKRLINIVVAAIFNIIIFGAGASIYLFAVDIITSTASLPGWLQLTLIWLCGVVGWLMLRPYRRITQLGGKRPMAEVVNIGSWHQRFFSDLKTIALSAGTAAVVSEDEQQNPKVKARTDKPAPSEGAETGPPAAPAPPPRRADQPAPSGTAAAPDDTDLTTGHQAGDERVWDPATGRYMYESGYDHDSDDLAASVAEADARLAADSRGSDQELPAEDRQRTYG